MNGRRSTGSDDVAGESLAGDCLANVPHYAHLSGGACVGAKSIQVPERGYGVHTGGISPVFV
eukprot:2710111-Amphidinium_carterae.1